MLADMGIAPVRQYLLRRPSVDVQEDHFFRESSKVLDNIVKTLRLNVVKDIRAYNKVCAARRGIESRDTGVVVLDGKWDIFLEGLLSTSVIEDVFGPEFLRESKDTIRVFGSTGSIIALRV